MKTSNALLFIFVLLYINASTQWPTHTVCKEDNLEIYYKSCENYVECTGWLESHNEGQNYALNKFKAQDPQQDFALSIDHCPDIATHTFNIRAATVLGHSIKELYVKLEMIVNGKTVLTYSETLCGPGHSKLIFCGMKKGEHLYYEGPVTLGIKEIPQGDYTLSAKLTNQDHVIVACADFTVKNYLDYY